MQSMRVARTNSERPVAPPGQDSVCMHPVVLVRSTSRVVFFKSLQPQNIREPMGSSEGTSVGAAAEHTVLHCQRWTASYCTQFVIRIVRSGVVVP